MKPLDQHEENLRKARAVSVVVQAGFTSLGGWLFRKGGHTYDLSAADLSKLGQIEKAGYFRI